jgi:hypothetical protein
MSIDVLERLKRELDAALNPDIRNALREAIGEIKRLRASAVAANSGVDPVAWMTTDTTRTHFTEKKEIAEAWAKDGWHVWSLCLGKAVLPVRDDPTS